MFWRDRPKHRPRCFFAWGCFRYFSWEGLAEPQLAAAPAFAQVGFGAAAFTRFASEGWWARQDSNLQPDRYDRQNIDQLR
jgi:hypothetical protein